MKRQRLHSSNAAQKKLLAPVADILTLPDQALLQALESSFPCSLDGKHGLKQINKANVSRLLETCCLEPGVWSYYTNSRLGTVLFHKTQMLYLHDNNSESRTG